MFTINNASTDHSSNHIHVHIYTYTDTRTALSYSSPVTHVITNKSSKAQILPPITLIAPTAVHSTWVIILPVIYIHIFPIK